MASGHCAPEAVLCLSLTLNQLLICIIKKTTYYHLFKGTSFLYWGLRFQFPYCQARDSSAETLHPISRDSTYSSHVSPSRNYCLPRMSSGLWKESLESSIPLHQQFASCSSLIFAVVSFLLRSVVLSLGMRAVSCRFSFGTPPSGRGRVNKVDTVKQSQCTRGEKWEYLTTEG